MDTIKLRVDLNAGVVEIESPRDAFNRALDGAQQILQATRTTAALAKQLSEMPDADQEKTVELTSVPSRVVAAAKAPSAKGAGRASVAPRKRSHAVS
ncbi:MAG: hypothetical protein AAFV62_13615 [Pseudomonadota bacterium]